MQDQPPCPICASHAWTRFGSRTYTADSIAKSSGSGKTNLRVLFEVWLPGKDTFSPDFAGCNECGFFCYHPRPTEDDLHAKYAFGTSLGDETRSAGEHPTREARRAQRVWDIVAPHLSGRSSGARNILDFGGGSGKLMARFLSAGDTCFLIDYCKEVSEGVLKIGNTENDLSDYDARFDAIICSHVIEHLANPLATVRKLTQSLASDGVIYMEVPMEVFGRLPAAREPVTHINFFTPQSFENLMVAAGLSVTRCELTTYPHPTGGLKSCIVGIGRRDASARAPVLRKGLVELEKLLTPTLAMRLRREVLLAADLPRRVTARVAHKFRAEAKAVR